MSSTAPDERRSRRGLYFVIGTVVVVALIALAVAVALVLFFGSDAPDAPTLEGALDVLLVSPAP